MVEARALNRCWLGDCVDSDCATKIWLSGVTIRETEYGTPTCFPFCFVDVIQRRNELC